MRVFVVMRELKWGFGDIWGIYSTEDLAKTRLTAITNMENAPNATDMVIREYSVDDEQVF